MQCCSKGSVVGVTHSTLHWGIPSSESLTCVPICHCAPVLLWAWGNGPLMGWWLLGAMGQGVIWASSPAVVSLCSFVAVQMGFQPWLPSLGICSTSAVCCQLCLPFLMASAVRRCSRCHTLLWALLIAQPAFSMQLSMTQPTHTWPHPRCLFYLAPISLSLNRSSFTSPIASWCCAFIATLWGLIANTTALAILEQTL